MSGWARFVDCENYVYVRHPEFGRPYCLPCLYRGARVPLLLQDEPDERGRKLYLCERPEKHRIVVRRLWTHRASSESYTHN